MFPVEDFCLAQQFSNRLRKPFANRVRAGAEIGMMNESRAADLQLPSQFAEVGFDHFAFRMHERIEAKHEID